METIALKTLELCLYNQKTPTLKPFENQPTKNIQEDKAGMRMTDCQIF